MSKSSPGDLVFKMLEAQYKPVEISFLAFCKREGLDDLVERYPKLSSIQKIRVLDLHAQQCGL